MPLVCFTNCFLATEDGELEKRDLWIDDEKGIVVDSQRTFFKRRVRPTEIVDLGGNILSPGFLDIQINGAYGFDFSIYEGDDARYIQGLEKVAERIVETGVTSLVPTIVTQRKSLYPKLLSLLAPRRNPGSAHLLGWHAEGPFLQMAKRGAHDPTLVISSPEEAESFEDVYGASAIAAPSETSNGLSVRIITAAPEIPCVLDSITTLTRQGVTFSIGHSIASSDQASEAVRNGARLITHLFNAMPVLHHRDPGIVGLLGASPAVPVPNTNTLKEETSIPTASPAAHAQEAEKQAGISEALAELPTPPRSPTLRPQETGSGSREKTNSSSGQLHGTDESMTRPYYGIIVDGVHIHPNSVRLAYMAHKEGCILITDAMAILDPHLEDGTYEWRDGRKLVKEGVKLYLDGSDTLAGSVVSMDICVRNFAKFTGCGLASAIKCATYNPARCLKIEHKKGTLRPGADADLVVLDHEGNVTSTWIGGKRAWGC